MRLDQYIGLPFKDHGRDRCGVDCWGLVRLVLAEQCDIQLGDYLYRDTRDQINIPAAFAQGALEWQPVAVGQPGDLVLLRVGSRPMHVGLVVEEGLMLHVQSGVNGSLIEHYNGPKWGGRIEGIYRYGR